MSHSLELRAERSLRQAKRLRPAMRVIVASAYGEEFAATSLQADVERFIRKPYSLRDLVGLVRQALSRSVPNRLTLKFLCAGVWHRPTPSQSVVRLAV